MKTTLKSKLLAAVCLLSPLPALAQSYPVEGLNPALPLIGQDGWFIPAPATDGTASIDTTIVSPMDGSTQSIRFRGDANQIRATHTLPSTLNSGKYAVSYDLYLTERTSTNLVARVGIRTAAEVSLFVPYAQDGGAGAAQNGFVGHELPTPGIPAVGDIVQAGFTYAPNHWYRFAFTLNFDDAKVQALKIYDIASGTPTLLAQGTTDYFFQNDGTSYYRDWSRLTLGLDANSGLAEGWNFDNFTVTAVPEPAGALPVAILSVASLTFRRRRPTR